MNCSDAADVHSNGVEKEGERHSKEGIMKWVWMCGKRGHLWLLLVLAIPVSAAAVDVSGTYTATVPGDGGSQVLLALTLTQQGTSVSGSLEVTNSDCFTSLTFSGTLSGSVLNGAFTDNVSRIDVRLTASGNKLSGTYNISMGDCKGQHGNVTFTRQAVPTPTPTVTPSPTVPPSCVGDCDGNTQVAVDETVTLARIALGDADAPGCPRGIPSGDQVDIALIVQAVNNVLKGCH